MIDVVYYEFFFGKGTSCVALRASGRLVPLHATTAQGERLEAYHQAVTMHVTAVGRQPPGTG